MDGVSLWLLVACAVTLLLAVGAAAAWLRHRARLAQVQRQLAWSEESRFQLVQHAEAVDARLAEMAETLARQQRALNAARTHERRPVPEPDPATAAARPADLMALAVTAARGSRPADAHSGSPATGGPRAAWLETEPQALAGPASDTPVDYASTVPAGLDPPPRRR